ncbi:MAG: RluA family pseudouridine synthase [Candidatus Saganbacteria bacterium]|nr:RluA family pseudouridine synthase [Candidatus Saganbacteria bacterium]
MDFFITKGHSKKRIDHYLSSLGIGLSRSKAKILIEEEKIFVNDRPTKPSYNIKADDKITVNIPEPRKLEVLPEDIPLSIVYEDDDIIVVNKKKGMVTHPAPGNYTGTLINALLYHCKKLSSIGGAVRPGLVHRLDKDTSGLLVIAKNDASHQSLSKQIHDRTASRKYVALLHGRIENDEGIVEAKIGRHPVHRKKMSVILSEKLKSKAAVSHYRVLKRFKKYTLAEVVLKTGRTHQIRVHMAHIGHPIVGDQTYGRRSNEFGATSQLLHAKTLGFVHPRSKKYMEFNSDLPDEMQKVIERIKD